MFDLLEGQLSTWAYYLASYVLPPHHTGSVMHSRLAQGHQYPTHSFLVRRAPSCATPQRGRRTPSLLQTGLRLSIAAIMMPPFHMWPICY